MFTVILTGPLPMFLTVVLSAVVLQRACHPPLPMLLLMLLVLLYLHTAPHPPSNTPHHRSSPCSLEHSAPHHLPSVVHLRVLSPLRPSMFLTPLLMYCAATFHSSCSSQSILPHLHIPHAPPHAPRAPPHAPRAPPHAP